MTPGDVVERLETLKPFECEAVALFRRLRDGGASAIELYPEIDRAVRALRSTITSNEGVIARCMGLRARPGRKVPPGF